MPPPTPRMKQACGKPTSKWPPFTRSFLSNLLLPHHTALRAGLDLECVRRGSRFVGDFSFGEPSARCGTRVLVRSPWSRASVVGPCGSASVSFSWCSSSGRAQRARAEDPSPCAGSSNLLSLLSKLSSFALDGEPPARLTLARRAPGDAARSDAAL